MNRELSGLNIIILFQILGVIIMITQLRTFIQLRKLNRFWNLILSHVTNRKHLLNDLDG